MHLMTMKTMASFFENIILLTAIDSSIKHIIKIQLHCQLECYERLTKGSLLCSDRS